MRARSIAGFLVRFAAVYAILIAPWPGLTTSYGRLYCAVGELLFGSRQPERSVRLVRVDPARSPDASWQRDTAIILEIRGARVGHRHVPPFGATRSSRYTGYVPTAILIALVVATPIPWRRRAEALLWGVLLISAFAALMVAAWIHGWFLMQESIFRAESSNGWSLLSRGATSLLLIDASMGPYYVAPVLVWLGVVMMRRDGR